MTQSITHGKKVVEFELSPTKVLIKTEGYHDGLRSSKEEIREDTLTSEATLLADLIKCLDVLKTDTPDLTIVIKKSRGVPYVIQKTWRIKAEKL